MTVFAPLQSKSFAINTIAPALDATLESAFYTALEALKTHLAPTAHLRTDSRDIEPGDAFLAYAVEGLDLQSYIQDALRQGASVVLYEPATFSTVDPVALQSGMVQAIPGLAKLAGPLASTWYGEPSADLFLVGITGTNGKTSCSHWIAQALCGLHLPCGIIGTLGSGPLNQLTSTGFTTPNAPQFQYQLAQLRDAKLRAVALEASSHALHLGRLNGTALDVAVFTNLSQDHLDYHGTFEAYAAAKQQLLEWPNLSYVVINRDDPVGALWLTRIQGSTHAIAYGIHTDATSHTAQPPLVDLSNTMDWPTYAATSKAAQATATAKGSTSTLPEFVYASKLRATSRGTAFEVHSSWGNGEVEIAALGAFNVSNALAVLATLIAAHIPFKRALAQLAKLTPVAGRMQKVGGNLQANEPLVVIDYAHTPDALEKALSVLRAVAQQRGGELACVVGCGGNRDAQKRSMMGKIAEQLADKVVLTSDNPRNEIPAAIIDAIALGMDHPAQAKRIEDRAVAILQTIRQAHARDVVILAGKGHEATQEIQGKKLPFSDHDHARLALAARGSKNALSHAANQEAPLHKQNTLREIVPHTAYSSEPALTDDRKGGKQ